MSRLLIVPAAGVGSRLTAGQPKALVPLAGRPMIDHVIERIRSAVDHVVVVANPMSSGAVRVHMEVAWPPASTWDVVEQPSPTGMLDAIMLARPIVAHYAPDIILVAWCDQAAVLPATVERLVSAADGPGAPALVLPTVRQEDPYIHLQRGADGNILAVLHRREGDALPDVGESDMGLFALSRRAYAEWLPQYAGHVATSRGTGERNFLPFIAWLAARERVMTIPCTDPREAIGINTPEDLAFVEGWLRERAADAP